MRCFAYLLVLGMLGCGPSGSGGNGGNGGNGGVDAGETPDAYVGPTGSVSGTVWAPGNAPGMVPAGHEIPLFGAVVYLSLNRPPPIPQETYCEPCVEPPGNAVLSDHDGRFVIANAVPGTYWLIIQKGQFRLEQEIVVAQGALDLPAAATTMPSEHDPDGGKWVPRIALASGIHDTMEAILGKMGLGEVDSSGRFVASSAAGNFDVYSNGGNIDAVAVGTLAQLMTDLDRMLDYHVIFIPCAGTANTSVLQNQETLRNIRDYVAAGGKLYVTDWSGEWSDNVFPAQVELGNGVDTPPEAYDPITDTWNTALFGSADGSPSYTSNDAEAVDMDLYDWLDGQMGPLAAGGTGTYHAGNFAVTGNWNRITKLETVEVGTDEEGFPIYDQPKAFIIGSEGGANPKRPLTVTFEPAGCGRVLYSTYHTTSNTHTGLVPQERVLLYLIMEIGVCKAGPIIQ
jgi:hypothetical protein